MTKARSSIINKNIVGTYHCMSRCVRQTFLCGVDPQTERNFDYRKLWLEDRLATLAGSFLIDVLGYAIMSNHIHVIVRNRPDLAEKCSDRQIVLRWRQIVPLYRTPEGLPVELTEEDITQMVADKKKVAEWRSRLADISWLMALWKQPIARRANAEDGIRGHFWESRFKSVALLDQAAILTCTAYVDLNPIRAGIADTPETSLHTSVRRRIRARQVPRHQRGRRTGGESWLCPLLDKQGRKGFLNMGLDRYLELLDWSGRQLLSGEQGAIPRHLEPILRRLDVNPDQWYAGCLHFGSMFYRVAGRFSNMVRSAQRVGQKWHKGKNASKLVFI